ncbi:MAG: maleylpyruvate isomerase family mycothiol-dependent enzyme [Actinoplanes sp.]
MDAVRWMTGGTTLFLGALATVPDARLDEPIALPGWTRRHLVAHVALNAAALGNLVAWARTGVETPMYASTRQRDDDIQAGATRPPAELRAWVARSATQLGTALSTLSGDQWQHRVRTAQGRDRAAAEIPWMRAREVLVHAVDLDAGIGFGDLPRDFLAALAADITEKRSGAGPALHLIPSDDDRTWTIGGEGAPTEVRGSLAGLTAYLAGRPHAGVDPAPARRCT